MPGIFGAIGCPPKICEELKRIFELPWGSGESMNIANGILGGHAFPPHKAVHVLPEGTAFAVDGEISVYLNAAISSRRPSNLFSLDSRELKLGSDCKGNLALVDSDSGLWFLAAEWSGTFPLYYLITDTGLVFCNRQRPIARLFDLPSDPLGILEHARYGYTLAGRTFFRNLRRLLPGQVLSYNPLSKQVSVQETSEAWAGNQPEDAPLEEVADRCWNKLLEAVKNGLPDNRRHAIMLSGGWDSRTVLAAAAAHIPRESLLGYCYGDTEGRELRTARSLCESLSVPFLAEPIDDRSFDCEPLNRWFERTEDVRYPYWHRAGEVLSNIRDKLRFVWALWRNCGWSLWSDQPSPGNRKGRGSGQDVTWFSRKNPYRKVLTAGSHRFVSCQGTSQTVVLIRGVLALAAELRRSSERGHRKEFPAFADEGCEQTR